LPTSRELVAALSVSPITVRRIVARLESEGLLETHPGVGTFVAAQPHHVPVDFSWQSEALGAARATADAFVEVVKPPPPDALVLSAGYASPDLLPVSLLATALSRSARRPDAWGRVELAGLPALRSWFAHDLGSDVSPGDVVIAPGNQAALAGVLRALTHPGDTVLLESPTYVGGLAALRAAGLVALPVLSDREGPLPDRLAERLATTGARVLFAQPTYANPTGGTWSASRRADVLDVVREANAFIVEDDWANRLNFDEPAPRHMLGEDPHGHVIYLRGLSKSMGPGMRVAGIVARGPAGHRLRAARVIEDVFVSGVLQEAALEVLTSSSWERHLRRLRRELRARRDALVSAVRRELGDASITRVPAGGFHLWVRLSVDDVDLARRAAAHNIVVSPGRPHFPAEPTGSYLRLSFIGADELSLQRGIAQLAQLV
jgi:DNA-binding transcriptional MocR family regulator